jgi:hypothetical protein
MSRIPPAKASDFTTEELTAAAFDMDHILEQEAQLNDFGYGVNNGFRGDPAKRQANFQAWRKSVREQDSLAQFVAARGWLRRFNKRKSLNKCGSSYGLKHVAEGTIGYITNGVFIAAAIAEGFQARRIGDGPNAWFNISSQAWKRPDRREGSRVGSSQLGPRTQSL